MRIRNLCEDSKRLWGFKTFMRIRNLCEDSKALWGFKCEDLKPLWGFEPLRGFETFMTIQNLYEDSKPLWIIWNRMSMIWNLTYEDCFETFMNTKIWNLWNLSFSEAMNDLKNLRLKILNHDEDGRGAGLWLTFSVKSHQFWPLCTGGIMSYSRTFGQK